MRSVTFLIFLFAISVILLAETIRIPIEFSENDFVIERDDFTRVYYKDGTIGGSPGEPQYPVISIHALLPPNSIPIDVRIENENWALLTTGTPFPAQPPAILSIGDPGIVAPDAGAYLSPGPCPQNPILAFSDGNMSGYSLAGICLAPLRWKPVTGVAERLTSGELVIEFEPGSRIAPSRRSSHSNELWRRAIGSLVTNPEALNSYSVTLDDDAYDWALFLPAGTSVSLTELLRLRRGWGLRDTVIYLDEVYVSFPGVDQAEKLRNAIADLYMEYGITYAVLAGDPMLMPDRWVFAMTCEAGFYDDEDQIRADLYFSDLDGSWNADGDTIWGEVEDSVDLYPDVFIGRYSLIPTSELGDYIDKIVAYETIPAGGFATHGLMLGQVLWDDPYTDGGAFKDDLIDEVFPDDFTFGKVYSRDGGDAEIGLDSLDTGPNTINHAGHASSSVICLDHGSCIWLMDMNLLTNAARPSIMFSIGCWPAAFDKDCIAEHYVNSLYGGGAAFIGNSRYGWGSPGNPGWGYSEVVDREFWLQIFDGNPQLGFAMNLAKIKYAPYAQWENVWRWVVYQLNILGDPATAVLDGSEAIALIYELSGSDIGITITDGTSPLSDAIVTVQDDGGLIDRAVTDYAGRATIDMASATAPVFLTARHGTSRYVTQTLSTLEAGFYRYAYNSGYGYSDGTADRGDTVRVDFTIGGFDHAISGISWSPNSDFGAPISVSPAPADLSAGDSTVLWATFEIPESISPGTSFTITPSIIHSGGTIGYAASLELNIPEFEFTGASLLADDGVFDSGETAQLRVWFENTGNGQAGGQPVSITCPGGELDITGSPCSIPPIEPSETGQVGPLTLEWATGVEAKPVVRMAATIEDDDCDFYLATRLLGFIHDAETDDSPFNLGSPPNLWHRTTRKAYSGDYSWWCGSNSTGTYFPTMNDLLYSNPVIIGDGSELSFMAYMAFPNYGSDGLHVELIGSADTVKLDYLGSGGALLSFIVGWSEYRYLLDDTPFEPGDTVSLHFSFTSDGEDQDEGVFLDDIVFLGGTTDIESGIGEGKRMPERLSLRAYPNPFNSRLTIITNGVVPKDGAIAIFDLNGRLVRKFDNLPVKILTWDSRNSSGGECPSGVYFVRFISDEVVITTRAVLLK